MQYVFLTCSSAGCKKYIMRRSRVTYFLQPVRECIKKHVLHGQETVSIFIGNLYAIFNDILRKNHGTLLYCRCSAALWQWAILSWGVFLNSVRPMGLTPFNAFPFWVIFCHIMLECSWVIGFCLHFVECTLQWQSPTANRVLYKHQCKLIDVSDCRVMIFLTTILERHQWLTLNWYH